MITQATRWNCINNFCGFSRQINLKNECSIGDKSEKLTEFSVPGYKERVDFGEIIGKYALRQKNHATLYYPTSWGIIHHWPGGAVHVVPSNPGLQLDRQTHLLYITELLIKELNSNKIRGVKANWNIKNSRIAEISFYFDGNVSKEELENASAICTEIIADFPGDSLEERYIRWDYPKPLPKEFFAYRR